jgi:hypothetical protein
VAGIWLASCTSKLNGTSDEKKEQKWNLSLGGMKGMQI